MDRYPLAPSLLGDGLVGIVLPRAPVDRHRDVVELRAPFQAAVGSYDTAPRPSHEEYRETGEASAALLHLTTAAKARATAMRSGGKTPPTSSSVADEMKPSPDKLKGINKRKCVDPNKLRRREQCRANQARYRDKQRNAQLQLEHSVQQLHKELETLKGRFRDLSSRKRSNQSPWSIVAEVFRLLESSFCSPWRMARVQEMKNHVETRQILAVLERCFAHDAAMGGLVGVDRLMEQLRLYSLHFGSPSLQLQRIESVAPSVMSARSKLSVTLTEFTLRHAFPHVEAPSAENHAEGGGKMLYQRLLGQRLECNCSLNFLFDEDSDRVVRLETSIDWTTPLLRLLGDFKDVVVVLEHAPIMSECVVTSTSEVMVEAHHRRQ